LGCCFITIYILNVERGDDLDINVNDVTEL
jgi:hypothetical protein